MAEICVIGAGPAGSVFATRMAQLGHQVHLIERQRFPRAHLGESLSAGVMALLRSADMHGAIDAARFPRVKGVWARMRAKPASWSIAARSTSASPTVRAISGCGFISPPASSRKAMTGRNGG
jgi:flavin-dependent dehydrogenase